MKLVSLSFTLLTGLLATGCTAFQKGETPSLEADIPARVEPIPPPPIEVTETPGWDVLDDLVEAGLGDETYPGAVLIVGQPSRIIWAKAYGNKTYDEDAESMTLESIFDLASVTKVLGTTSAALALMEDDKLSPDDLVAEYIPGFGTAGKETVTIRDLMTHTSGLKAYENKNRVEKERPEGTLQSDALINHYAALKVSYEPRTDYRYSCLNFQTTARVTENIAGMRMEDYLKERVYGPLDMRNTVYSLSEEQKKRVVPTLKRSDGTVLISEVHDPLANYHGVKDHCPGNAGLFAPATDVARYCEMIARDGDYYGREIYKPATIAMATKDQTPEGVDNKRGLGWGIYESAPYCTDLNNTPETYVIGHTGYTGTMIWIDKRTDTYMVFFTNRVYPDDKSQPEHKLSISDVRRNLADAILRHLPEYQDSFDSK